MTCLSAWQAKICHGLNKARTRAETIAQNLHRKKISANFITLSGLAFALLGLNFLALRQYFFALVCLLANRLCDFFDGLLARQSPFSQFGIFFDIFADYTAAALFIWGLILGTDSAGAAAGSFYLTALNIFTAALLGYHAVTPQNIAESCRSPLKKCLLGPLQNLDIFLAVFLLCLFPALFMPISIFFGLLLLGKALLILSGAYYQLAILKNRA